MTERANNPRTIEFDADWLERTFGARYRDFVGPLHEASFFTVGELASATIEDLMDVQIPEHGRLKKIQAQNIIEGAKQFVAASPRANAIPKKESLDEVGRFLQDIGLLEEYRDIFLEGGFTSRAALVRLANGPIPARTLQVIGVSPAHFAEIIEPLLKTGGGGASRFELRLRGKNYPITDVNALFTYGKKYLMDMCDDLGLPILHEPIGYYSRLGGFIYITGSLTEELRETMLTQAHVVLTDENDRSAQRASVTTITSATTTYISQAKHWRSLDLRIASSEIEIVSVDDILKHCGFDKLERHIDDIEDLRQIERCLGRSRKNWSDGWFNLSNERWNYVDGGRRYKHQESVDVSPEALRRREEYLEMLGEPLADAEEVKEAPTSLDLFGASDGPMQTVHHSTRLLCDAGNGRSKFAVCVWWLSDATDCTAIMVQKMLKVCEDDLKIQPGVAYSFGMLVRGMEDYMLILVTQKNFRKHRRMMLTSRIDVYSRSHPFPDLILMMLRRFHSEKPLIGLAKRTAEEDIRSFLVAGGQSFVFEAKERHGERRVVLVKFMKRMEDFERINEFHERTAGGFPELLVHPVRVLRATRSFTYPILRQLTVEEFTCRQLDPWKDFAQRLWDFHEEFGIVHMDINPNNLVVTANSVIKLCDFGSWVVENSQRRTMSTPPYFSSDLVGADGPDRSVDYVMLLRTIDSVMRKGRPHGGGFHPSCMKGQRVTQVSDLKNYVEEVYMQR